MVTSTELWLETHMPAAIQSAACMAPFATATLSAPYAIALTKCSAAPRAPMIPNVILAPTMQDVPGYVFKI